TTASTSTSCAPRSRPAPGCCSSTRPTTPPARGSPPTRPGRSPPWPGSAGVAREHELVVVTDEVYEHLTFDAVAHVPLATLPGMRERTLTISSGGKTFNTTRSEEHTS